MLAGQAETAVVVVVELRHPSSDLWQHMDRTQIGNSPSIAVVVVAAAFPSHLHSSGILSAGVAGIPFGCIGAVVVAMTVGSR